jgi:hypothetical protein
VSPVATDRGAEVAELIDRHYKSGAGVRKDRDAHWSISERYSYGRHAGWVIEHDGYCYDGLEGGEDGPFPTREEAEVMLIEHLLAAIARVEAREG